MKPITTFVRDRRGAALAEFALVLPVMLALYLGMTELVQAFQAQKKATGVAATIADLATQDTSVTDATLAGIFTAGEMVMSPFPKAALRQRLAHVSADKDGVVTTDWTAARNWSGGAAAAVPDGMLGPNESIVVASIVYEFESPVDWFLPNGAKIKQTAYYRPRLSSKVEKK